jgi:hypothetical protein
MDKKYSLNQLRGAWGAGRHAAEEAGEVDHAADKQMRWPSEPIASMDDIRKAIELQEFVGGRR